MAKHRPRILHDHEASVDLLDEDLRRLVVNVAFHLVGLPVPGKADVAFVDFFEPTFYSAQKSDYYQKRNLKPADYMLGRSPATGLANPEPKKDGPKPGNQPKKDEKLEEAPVQPPHAPNAEPPAATSARPQAVAPPSKGERIVLIGNGLAERDVHYGRIETELHLRYPDRELFFRNMGHVGDTPGFRPHPARVSQWAFPGAEKFHPELSIHNGKGFFPTPDQWLTHLKADTIVAFFGFNESFDGPGRVANFQAELDAWVLHTLGKAYNGKAAPRIVLVSPVAFENLSADRDLPSGEKIPIPGPCLPGCIETVAKSHGLTFIDLFTPTKALYAQSQQPLTTGGFVPNDEGYRQIAGILADGLFGNRPTRQKPIRPWFMTRCGRRIGSGTMTTTPSTGSTPMVNATIPLAPRITPMNSRRRGKWPRCAMFLIHDIASGRKNDLDVDDLSQDPALPRFRRTTSRVRRMAVKLTCMARML
ncbi:MAG: hypothetical protein R3F31_12185 [Verrucomicrobiales bacterium]